MTGQAQTANFSQADFKTQVCNSLAGGLLDCTSGVYVDVKTYANFSAVNTASPIVNGQFDNTKMTYTPGTQGSIVVVTLYYQWPIYVSLLGSNLSNLNSGSRLLVATSVFRNEPY
jgi:Flp pilus assembly protein TadG